MYYICLYLDWNAPIVLDTGHIRTQGQLGIFGLNLNVF